MTHTEKDLVLLLQELGGHELDANELDAIQPGLQSVLTGILEPSVAQRLEYASYEVDWLGIGPKTLQGLAAEKSQLLLTEIADQMVAMSDEELAPLLAELDLTPEQARAGFFAAYWILNSLEWESRDRSIPAEFSPDKRKSMLEACLRSLRHFRETGEP